MDEWSQNYKEEAVQIIKQHKEDYKDMVRMSNVVAARMCETGNHTADSKISFCKKCKRSFCIKHGNPKKLICNNCFDDII
jgi:hypothetical protein